jgi:glycosyltransferase involved in cell wall biosynthesis
MEAMATELPVVATDVMGVPELVEHEVSGLLVAPARADLLAAALSRLLDDPELCQRMGRAGRRAVQERYERGAATAELRRLLAPLVAA